MRVVASRASVCAADDIEPHERTFEFADDVDLSAAIASIIDSGWLPRLGTWSIASNVIVAVVAMQWAVPKMTPAATFDFDRLDRRDGVLHLHFNYHVHINPQVAYDIFWNLRLRA